MSLGAKGLNVWGSRIVLLQQHSKTKIMLSSNKPRKLMEAVEVQLRSFVTSALEKDERLP